MARLDTMIEGGVIERVGYQEHPPRYEYILTTAGRELVPVLLLTAWGDRWRSPDGPPIVARHRCGSTAELAIVCAECGERAIADDMTYTAGPGGSADRIAERVRVTRATGASGGRGRASLRPRDGPWAR